jgi:hypothetical protein
MKQDGTTIGLLGVAAWLIGVVFVGAGQLGTFDPPPMVKIETSGPRCTFAFPRGMTPGAIARVTKKPKTCTDGDLQVTWGKCALRYNA